MTDEDVKRKLAVIFSAVLQLLTIGGLGIWMLADFLIIIFGEFSDGKGNKIKNWV